MWPRRKLEFHDLITLGSPQSVQGVNVAGLANQIRCLLAIQVLGHTPLIRRDAEFRKRVSANEGIDPAEIFGALQDSQSRWQAPYYREWYLPPVPSSAADAELFNILNWYGLLNPSALPHMKEKTRPYRDAFAALQPNRVAVPERNAAGSAKLAIHLRMFDRNYTPRFDIKASRKEHFGRFYAKQAWSQERVKLLLDIAIKSSDAGEDIAIYSDDVNHPVAMEIFSELSRQGRAPAFADSQPAGLTHSQTALYDLLSLSCHPRMILTATSSFGHMAALLNDDLESVVAA